MKTIEIIIPAYNCRSTLDRTLDSLDKQTDKDFAVHFIDDCSTEDLSDIIAAHNTLNIRVTRNPVNLGCGMTRQVGIDSTEADYIAFVDSDDVLLSHAVQTWRMAANAHPDTDVFHSYFFEQKVEDGQESISLKTDGYTWCHGKLYKVSNIRKYDIRNNPEIKYMDDSFFNSMCTELGNVMTICSPLYIWMNNSSSATRDGRMSKDACRYDFIHGMILSTEFVYSKGVKTIKHMSNTLKMLEGIKHEFSEKTLNEYNKLLNIINEVKTYG